METMETMEIENDLKQDILNRAKRVLHYNELLIKQCDSWLSAEEGNANMMKAIMERNRKQREEERRERWGKWAVRLRSLTGSLTVKNQKSKIENQK